jgi:hypothetical protein
MNGNMTMNAAKLITLALATALLPSALRAEQTNNWSFEVAPYLVSGRKRVFLGMGVDEGLLKRT